MGMRQKFTIHTVCFLFVICLFSNNWSPLNGQINGKVNSLENGETPRQKVVKAKNWEKIDLGLNDSFHDIEPINEKEVIAYSYGTGKIIKTVDGGENWKIVHQLDSIYLEQIQFLNDKIGYICGNDNTLLKTEDGGLNWTSIAIESLDAKAPIYGMHFVDEQNGFISVLAKSKKGNGYASHIYETKNAGEDWTKINELPDMILNIEVINNELWGSGNNVIVSNIDSPKWKYTYQDTEKEVGQIRDIVKTKNAFIAISFNGYIIRKPNGEKDWSKKILTNNRLRSIATNTTKDQNHLFIVGDNNWEKGNVFESTDGGQTWAVVEFEGDLEDLHRVYFTDKSGKPTFWAIGKNDLIIVGGE